MAARNSSVGKIVTIVTLLVAVVALFFTTVISFSNLQRLTRELEGKESDFQTAIPSDQRNDRWEALKAQYPRGVVPGMDEDMNRLARMITGSAGTPEQVMASVASELNVDTEAGERVPPLLGQIRTLSQRISALEGEISTIEAAKATLENDLDAAQRNARRQIQDMEATYGSASAEVDEYRRAADDYAGQVRTTREGYDRQLASIRNELEGTIDDLNNQVRSLQDRLLTAEDALARRSGDSLRLLPEDEASIVDARVIATNLGQDEVFLSIGRRDKVQVGLTFEVYSATTAIRPGVNGEFPLGKATVEVVRIGENSSTARVIRSQRGNPVIESDKAVNALYDPNKSYRFIVFGNFDSNRDGRYTPQEANQIISIVNEWGGGIDDEISGDTDFVVLGRRPIIPPEPRFDDPPAKVTFYRTKVLEQRRYDELLQKAERLSIPVLNHNRLLTLTGLHAERG